MRILVLRGWTKCRHSRRGLATITRTILSQWTHDLNPNLIIYFRSRGNSRTNCRNLPNTAIIHQGSTSTVSKWSSRLARHSFNQIALNRSIFRIDRRLQITSTTLQRRERILSTSKRYIFLAKRRCTTAGATASSPTAANRYSSKSSIGSSAPKRSTKA